MFVFVVLLVLAFALVAAVLLREWQYKSWREKKPQWVPLTFSDWVLFWSPPGCAIVAFCLLRIEYLRQILVDATSGFLSLTCRAFPFFQLCIMSRPLDDIAVLQLVGYIAFLCGTFIFVWRIFLSGYRLPPDFDPKWNWDAQGSFAVLFSIFVWLGLLIGGQSYVAGGGVVSITGVMASLLTLAVGVGMGRGICLWIRFGLSRSIEGSRQE